MVETPCRRYRGTTRNCKDGHCRIRRGGKWIYLHRWVWEQINGPVPEGLVVRHRCDTPDCFRYDHLEVGTKADNTHDMIERGRARNGKERDHCAHGHPYDEKNTYHRKDRPGHRECRACRREATRRYEGGQ